VAVASPAFWRAAKSPGAGGQRGFSVHAGKAVQVRTVVATIKSAKSTSERETPSIIDR
jgi:hypothetical protein